MKTKNKSFTERFSKGIAQNAFVIAIIGAELLFVGNRLIPECGTPLNTIANKASFEVPVVIDGHSHEDKANLKAQIATSTAQAADAEYFNDGMVSLTFDDGWLSHYNTAYPILEKAGFKGSFYVISRNSMNAQPINSIQNGDLEYRDVRDKELPSLWFVQSSGRNQSTSKYPVKGLNGSCAVRVDMKEFETGEVEWVFDEVAVIGGHEYEYNEYYKSNATTSLVARLTYRNGTKVFKELGELAPAKDWTRATKTILMPRDTATVTVYHRLATDGFLLVDSVHLDHLQRYMTTDHISEIWQSGHEVGSHTQTHPDLSRIPLRDAEREIVGSQSDLSSLGISPSKTFVYPYGLYNQNVIRVLKDNGFIAARSSFPGFNYASTPRYELRAEQVDLTTTLAEFKAKVDAARENKTWVIFMFHQVDNTGEYYSVTPVQFQRMIDYLKESDTRVVTLEEGLEHMK